MLEFQVASKQQVEKEQGVEEAVVEFSIAGQTFESRRPSPGQINIFFGSGGAATQTLWQIFENILVGDGYERLRKLVWDGDVPPKLLFGGDELNPGGIFDSIVKEFSGRPTEPSSGSSESPSSAGRKSTGRSPSTRSNSA